MAKHILAFFIGCAWICGLVLIGIYVNTAYGCELRNHQDQRSILGLYIPASRDRCVSFGEMNLLYIEAQACTGLMAPGPTIIYAPLKESKASAYGPLSTVIINSKAGQRSRITEERALRHEFVSHLLYMNGRVMDYMHPLYKRCAN